MKKFTKIALSALSLASVAAISIAGTVAYLTSTDADINVMTLGNVKIEQHEYERATNEDGSFKVDTIDDRDSYVLQDFTQGKALVPATDPTNNGAGNWDSTTVRMSQVNSYGGMDVFSNKNAQDKFVTVENTGKTDAYVRTLVAIECGSASADLIGISHHNTWERNNIGTIEIDSVNYYLIEYVYAGAQLSDGSYRHAKGVLSAGDTTYPNLSQVYIGSEATNEDMAALDGNSNGTLDILVFSQAVQAEGFDNATAALDAAFGDITAKNHPWSNGVVSAPAAYITEGTVDVNDVIILSDDGEATDCVTADGEGVVVNINSGIYDLANQNVLGNGCAVWAKNGAVVNINGGEFYCNAINGEVSSANHSDLIYAGANGGVINIYGGFFQTATAGDWILNERDDEGTITVYGGTFVNWNPADNVSEGAGTNFVADDYEVVKEEQANGDIWYTVVESK